MCDPCIFCRSKLNDYRMRGDRLVDELINFHEDCEYEVTLSAKFIVVYDFQQTQYFEQYNILNSEMLTDYMRHQSDDNMIQFKNNSLFGKTMENVRGRMDMRLCQTAEKLMTYTSKTLFQSCTVFGQDLVGVQLLKGEVLLDKPVHIGRAVLDLSKLVMYQLHYDQLTSYDQ